MTWPRPAVALGVCLWIAFLVCPADDASAWPFGEPQFEPPVVTDGDPDGPFLSVPGPVAASEKPAARLAYQALDAKQVLQRVVPILFGV